MGTRNSGKPETRPVYEWKSAAVQVTGTDPTTDITADADFTTLFDTIKAAGHLKVSVDGNTLYMRLNSSSADVIQVTSTTPFESFNTHVRRIYIATNNASITTTIFMEG